MFTLNLQKKFTALIIFQYNQGSKFKTRPSLFSRNRY